MLPIVVILTAVPAEFKEASTDFYLDQPKAEFINGILYTKGLLRVKRTITAEVYIRECGQLNINSSQETERAVNLLHPDYIIFIGIAGGRKDVEIGDIVFGNKVYYYEEQKITSDGIHVRPRSINPTFSLEEIAKMGQIRHDWIQWLREEARAANLILGPILSGEKLLDDYNNEIGEIIDRNFNDTTAIDKESYGFMQAVSRQVIEGKHINFAVVRGISDLVKTKSTVSAIESKRPSNIQKLASHVALGFSFWMLSEHIQRYYTTSPSSLPTEKVPEDIQKVVAIFPEIEAEITTPQRGDIVLKEIYCAGTINNVPDKAVLCLAVEVDGLVWPKETKVKVDNEGNWHATIWHDSKDPGEEISIALWIMSTITKERLNSWLFNKTKKGFPGMERIDPDGFRLIRVSDIHYQFKKSNS